ELESVPLPLKLAHDGSWLSGFFLLPLHLQKLRYRLLLGALVVQSSLALPDPAHLVASLLLQQVYLRLELLHPYIFRALYQATEGLRSAAVVLIPRIRPSGLALVSR